jgi:hypothetical protein
MALACAATAFLGFLPTYFTPLASRSLAVSPAIHIHAMVFFTWSVFFAFQAWLASSGRIARHRSTGLIGVSLATAMTILGFLASVDQMKRAAALGQADAGIAFAIVPLTGIVFFAVVFPLSVASVRNGEVHKRLMLLAGISILDAPIARWFMTLPGASRAARPAAGGCCDSARACRLPAACRRHGVRLADAAAGRIAST